MEQQSEKSDATKQKDLKNHDGIYTLRTAHQHQTQLLILADQKANILIGIVVLLLTIVFVRTSFLSVIDSKLLIPFTIFICIEVLALFLALLVVMPKTVGTYKATSIEQMPNPLFFGFFTSYGEDEFLDFLSDNSANNRSARNLLIKDLYQAGQVLRKKYILLKYSYLCAVFGVALIALATTLLLFI